MNIDFDTDHLISDAMVRNVMYWTDLLKTTDNQKLRIGQRRLLSALNERDNPIDGFVDTIIALENFLDLAVEN